VAFMPAGNPSSFQDLTIPLCVQLSQSSFANVVYIYGLGRNGFKEFTLGCGSFWPIL
jgi:hypothetical protein